MKNFIGVYLFSIFITSFSWAAIELPNVIGSNMVLQRDLALTSGDGESLVKKYR